MHVCTADLVHEQHKDEAQNQRHADAGMKLLVTVLMFPAGTQGCFYLTLRLRHFQDAVVAVTVVSACRGTCHGTLAHVITDQHRPLWCTSVHTN